MAVMTKEMTFATSGRGAIPVFVALLALVLLSGCSGGTNSPDPGVSAQPEKAVPVKAARAEERAIDRRVEIVGTLLAEDEVVVGSEVEGVLNRIDVDLGSLVRQGDLLAQIDQREFQLQLEQAQAALAQARVRLGLRAGDSDEIDPEETPFVRQARATYEDARSKYESAKKLYATGDIAEQRYIEAEKTFKAREAAYQSAVYDVRDQLAGIQRLRAQMALAQKKLADATIRAPLTGSVTVKHASAGEYLKAGAPIVTVVKLNPLRLRADVPEPYAASIEVGRALSFTVDALRDVTFQGRVTRLSPSVNPETRSLTVEAQIDNRHYKLKPGYFARAQIVVQPGSKAIMIPGSAVVSYVGLTKTFVVEGGRAAERTVKLGARSGDWVEVVEGVRPNELVVTSNLSRVRDGQPVDVQ
jgi:RND family efflux transporter MFP subunit